MVAAAGWVLRQVLPARVCGWMAHHARPAMAPAPHRVQFGSFRRVTPFSRRWGKDRGGQPIDRFYIERFLAAHAGDIRGRVLEVGDSTYTSRFGRSVEQSDVLHVVAGTPGATIIADLAHAPGIPDDSFDCIILTQVLQVIGDVQSAAASIHRILRPNGVMLATMAGIAQISEWDMTRWGEYWRFTTLSARRLFEPLFGATNVQVTAHGNVLAAASFLYGLSAEELTPEELAHCDQAYQLIVTVRARKTP